MPDYSLSVEPTAGYLHVRVSGVNTAQVLMRYLKEIYDVCLERNCPRVLIEENLAGPPLAIVDIFDVVSQRTTHVFPVVQRVAYVDVNPEHDQGRMKFAETVAVNRGLDIRTFVSVAEAEAWMTQVVAAT